MPERTASVGAEFHRPVSVLCIESDEQLYSDLKTHLSPFSFAQPECGKFNEYIDEIERKATTHSVFLYVDPWTVEGLDWNGMDRVFQHLSVSRMSIEILMNFNARSFVRRGLAALKLAVPESDPHLEDAEAIDAAIDTLPSIEPLNRVVGGDWWQDVLRSSTLFSQKVQIVTDSVCEKLSERFEEVCQYAVKAFPHHTVPKYYLIFASRHPDALVLMNNEMVKSQRTQAEIAKPEQPTLFETRPTDLVPDFNELPGTVLKHTVQPTQRKIVIQNVVRECFCQFAEKEIRSCIEQLLRDGKLKSETGKIRINDGVKIWAVPKISQ